MVFEYIMQSNYPVPRKVFLISKLLKYCCKLQWENAIIVISLIEISTLVSTSDLAKNISSKVYLNQMVGDYELPNL